MALGMGTAVEHNNTINTNILFLKDPNYKKADSSLPTIPEFPHRSNSVRKLKECKKDDDKEDSKNSRIIIYIIYFGVLISFILILVVSLCLLDKMQNKCKQRKIWVNDFLMFLAILVFISLIHLVYALITPSLNLDFDCHPIYISGLVSLLIIIFLRIIVNTFFFISFISEGLEEHLYIIDLHNNIILISIFSIMMVFISYFWGNYMSCYLFRLKIFKRDNLTRKLMEENIYSKWYFLSISVLFSIIGIGICYILVENESLSSELKDLITIYIILESVYFVMVCICLVGNSRTEEETMVHEMQDEEPIFGVRPRINMLERHEEESEIIQREEDEVKIEVREIIDKVKRQLDAQIHIDEGAQQVVIGNRKKGVIDKKKAPVVGGIYASQNLLKYVENNHLNTHINVMIKLSKFKVEGDDVAKEDDPQFPPIDDLLSNRFQQKLWEQRGNNQTNIHMTGQPVKNTVFV